MSTMRAIQMHEYGGPQVLRYEEAPRPSPGDGELLVRVLAAGVNPIDWKLRAGQLKDVVPLALPWIPGGDFSGMVDEIGPGVSDVRVGDEVFGRVDLPRDGSYAELVAVPRAHVTAKPRTLDHVCAAAVPLAALTAWQALFGGAGAPGLDLAAGQTLLVLGAAGGVGSFAVQLARSKGARVVALARAGHEDHVRTLGADQVVDDAHLADAGAVDAILDLVGGDLAQRAWPQLAPGGAFASTLGPPSAAEAQARRARAIAVFTRTRGDQLAEIAALIDRGAVSVVVSQTVPLADAARAHALLEAGGIDGKVALLVAKG